MSKENPVGLLDYLAEWAATATDDSPARADDSDNVIHVDFRRRHDVAS
jgi:hypothetical protein